MKLDEVRQRLVKISQQGYVPTHRKGPTGIGKTLEDLLGIQENNISLPDIGATAELKAHRKGQGGLITLFTLEPEPRARNAKRDQILLDMFGYKNPKEDRPRDLYSTLYSQRFNEQGLKLTAEKNLFRVLDIGRKLDVYWTQEMVQKSFTKKFPALIYVLADTDTREDKEHFHYNEAYYLKGFDFEKFKSLVAEDTIVVDFRMHYKKNYSVRNHGTAFRVKENSLYNCFDQKESLI